MTLDEIRGLIQMNKLEEAEIELKLLSQNEPSEAVFLLLGNLCRKRGDWQHALNYYYEALELNPEGEAKMSIEHIQNILEFSNKDLINP
ncbi:MAG: tetratricopeptide repeat protein [Bacteroidales bacterium]|jgi:tetratricopeptide (TPR) repeat protein|nr:tetratricopeptide repeat protein [Bacteroidales bacterium]MDD3162188.1 tetratricopeptide repeat protein [Bacteroidales bacterium]